MKRLTIVALAVCVLFLTSRGRAQELVKVFILAGQSNMEGKAPNALYDHQATDPKTKELFAHLRRGDEWIRKYKSKPKAPTSDRQLHIRRFTAAYHAATGGHTKRVEAAQRALGIKRRTAWGYAKAAGLSSKQNGA